MSGNSCSIDGNNGDSDSDNENICTDRLKPRKIKPQNIVNRLIARELGGFRRPGTNIQVIREFYQNIFPNLTIINVEKPAGYLRKFSPDGKYLITFSYDQKSLEIYRFNGVVAAAHLIYAWRYDFVPSLNTDLPQSIRSQIFDKLFTVICSIIFSLYIMICYGKILHELKKLSISNQFSS